MDQGIMDTRKVRKIIENFDSNLINSTPTKNLVIDGGVTSNDTEKMDTHKNAFELLMGAKGDTRSKTPIKRRIKRLENGDFTKSGGKFMDLQNWARNSQKK